SLLRAAVREPQVVRHTLLADLLLEKPPSERLLSHHLHPALCCAQEAEARGGGVSAVTTFGTPAVRPRVSPVIPVGQRPERLEYQLAVLSLEPGLSAEEILFVLDGASDALRDQAAALYRIYRVPFRLVYLRHRPGFAGAVNAGASVAGGRLLLVQQ